MPKKTTTYLRKVNFYETDAQGVVHHSNYFRYLEEARGFLLDKLGYPYFKMHESGFFVVLIEANIRIKHPLKYQDDFKIYTEIYTENSYSLCFNYAILLGEKMSAKAYTKHCILKDGKLTKIPNNIFSLIND